MKSSTHPLGTLIETDVLVIGSGASGCGAALGAPVLGCGVAAIHLCGCAGDWYYVRTICRNPAIAYCEDTTWGVRLFGEGEEARA